MNRTSVNQSLFMLLLLCTLGVVCFMSFGCSLTIPKLQADVSVDGEDIWVWQATTLASMFWSEHQMDMMVGSGVGDIQVITDELTEGDNRIGEWRRGAAVDLVGVVALDYRAADHEAPHCVVAHEIGHATGMDHVEDTHSLMSPISNLKPDGNCPWTEYDQEEFCRANQEMCP